MTITLPDNPDCDDHLLRGNTYYHAQDPEDDEPEVPPYPVNEIQRERIVNWGPFTGRHPPSYENPPNYAPPPAGASRPPNRAPPAETPMTTTETTTTTTLVFHHLVDPHLGDQEASLDVHPHLPTTLTLLTTRLEDLHGF